MYKLIHVDACYDDTLSRVFNSGPIISIAFRTSVDPTRIRICCLFVVVVVVAVGSQVSVHSLKEASKLPSNFDVMLGSAAGKEHRQIA